MAGITFVLSLRREGKRSSEDLRVNIEEESSLVKKSILDFSDSNCHQFQIRKQKLQ